MLPSCSRLFLVGGLLALLAGDTFAQPGAVVLSDETTFRVDGRQGQMTRKVVVQINNANGRRIHGQNVVFYDDLASLRSFEGRILDDEGNEIRRLRRRDIQDRPYTTAGSLFDDHRVRVAELHHDTYPYVVEWRWVKDYASLLRWAHWFPQNSQFPVEHASLTLDTPTSLPIRRKVERMSPEEVVELSDGRMVSRWTVSLPRLRTEALSPDFSELLPRILFAPQEFEVERQRGSLATWEGFGDWYGALSAGRQELPDDAVAAVQRITSQVNSPRDKVRLLYEYLQERMRYVSVQLGIGGWQPFDAAYVHERLYGDCKALTNYLMALIQAAGLEAYPALIGVDRPDLDPSFPFNNFNHVVLYVPFDDNPVWIEATSRWLPFGSLGNGAHDRYALVVKPEGSELIRTPSPSYADNVRNSHVSATLAPDGSLSAEIDLNYTGEMVAMLRELHATYPADVIERWWLDEIGVSRMSLHAAEPTSLARSEPRITVKASMSASGFASRAGRRLILSPLVGQPLAAPGELVIRTHPIQLTPYPQQNFDEVIIELPTSSEAEVLFDPVEIETDFASYSANVRVEDGRLVYGRAFTLRAAQLPPERYGDVREFMVEVSRADAQSVVVRLAE